MVLRLFWDLNDLLVSFIVIVQSTLSISLMVVNYSKVEVSFCKLLGKESLDLWIPLHFILPHRIFEIFHSQVQLISLEIQTCEVKISFNVILVK